MCLDYFNFERLRQCRRDFGFHGYGEVCNFVYCLLMRTRKLSDLPGIHEWESYMDISKLSYFNAISMEEFLMDSDFGRELVTVKTSEMREFRVKCRECIDRLVSLILTSTAVTSGVSRGLYAFGPEIMLGGDDHHIFELFGSLCDLFRSCHVISSDGLNAAVAEFKSYVIEKRKHYEDATCAASEIPDVVQFLLRDFAFQSRTHVFRLFKMCCLVVGVPKSNLPAVIIDLGGSALSPAVVQDCVLLVQSHIISPSFNPRLFFSASLLVAVREAISESGIFFRVADFDVWKDFCSGDMESFAGHYRSLYKKYLMGRQKEYDTFYVESNKTNRRFRESQCSRSTEAGSATNSVVGSKKASSKIASSKSVKAGASTARSSAKVVSREDGAVAKKSGGGSASRKSRKDKSSDSDDPDVVHKLKKTSSKH